MRTELVNQTKIVLEPKTLQIAYKDGRVRMEITPQTFDGTLTAVSDGMQYGWTSPISIILLSPSSPVPVTHTDIVLLESLYMIGGFCGIPLTLYLLDRVGRKRTMLIASVLSLIGWIALATVPSLIFLFVIRFVMGIASEVNFAAAPVYIAEISEKNVRGRLGSLVYIMMIFGILLIYCIGPYVSITNSSIVGASVVTVQLLTFTIMPESPYYHLINNQRVPARKSLQVFRTNQDVETELNEIDASIILENLERRSALDLFRVKSNLKAVLIMTVLNTAQHFSGLTVMFMNMHSILDVSASILTPNQAAILFSLLMLVSCIVAGLLIDKVGRKILLCTSNFLTGISVFLLAFYFTVKNAGIDVYDFNWVPVLAVMLYAITYKYGLGLIPIVLTAEIFPSNVKAHGITYANFIYIFASTVSIYLYAILDSQFGTDVPFYFFGVCCMLTCLFSIFYVPETKGKSLEEIQRILKRKSSVPEDMGTDTEVEKNIKPVTLYSFDYGTNNF
ncbi:hypothetical protein FQR65_LT06201 [Abscondita terminalis]|nr:hypothetical protein FQR65_LT06201 [Abscondita terminalis]